MDRNNATCEEEERPALVPSLSLRKMNLDGDGMEDIISNVYLHDGLLGITRDQQSYGLISRVAGRARISAPV